MPESSLRVRLGRGVELVYDGGRVVLDPYGFNPGCGSALLTHAHRDHSRGYVRYRRGFATAETLDLLALYVGRGRLRGSGRIRIGDRFRLDELEVSVHDAGHVLGSVMYRVSTAEHTLLYTGDINCVETLVSKPAEEVPCDILILDSTFGYPYFKFPDRSRLYGRIVEWAVDTVKDGRIPVLHADSLGNSQELIVLFNRFTNIPVVAHHRVALVNEVYRRHGVRMEYISHNTEEGRELVKSGFCVYIAPKGAKVLLDKPIRKALVSGWALTFRNGFPLSDHADYPSLINYVARVRPKIVYTYPGGYSGRVLADRIRKVLGIPAQPLR